MQEIAFATDTQLKNIAQFSVGREFANSPKRKAERGFANMLPFMDSFLYGATTNGSISQKVLAGGNQLKDWGIFLLATNLYNKAIDKIVDNSETLQNFKENSPILYGTTNTILGLSAGISAIKYVNAGYKKFIAPLIPKKVKFIANNLVAFSDTSAVGKHINKGMEKLATNHPKITKSLGIVGRYALPLLCLGYIASLAMDVCKAKIKEEKIYNTLKDARLNAAQQLAMNNLQTEADKV